MTDMLELAHKDIKIARGKWKHEHNKYGSSLIKEIKEKWHWNLIWEPWLGNWGSPSICPSDPMSQGPERQEQETSWLFSSQKPDAQLFVSIHGFPQDPTFSLLKVRGEFKHCFSRSAIFTIHPSSHQLTIKQ